MFLNHIQMHDYLIHQHDVNALLEYKKNVYSEYICHSVVGTELKVRAQANGRIFVKIN